MKVNCLQKRIQLSSFLKPILFHLHSVTKFLTSLTTFRQDIVVSVKFLSWAALVVPVIKCDGIVRLRRLQTGYQHCNKEWSILYFLPWIQELFAAVSDGKVFSKLDFSHDYLQFQLDESSQDYVTINTYCGLNHYTCLLFDVALALATFHRTMGTTLKGLPIVVAYLDNILILV